MIGQNVKLIFRLIFLQKVRKHNLFLFSLHKALHFMSGPFFGAREEKAKSPVLLLKALGEVSLVVIFGASMRFPNT